MLHEHVHAFDVVRSSLGGGDGVPPLQADEVRARDSQCSSACAHASADRLERGGEVCRRQRLNRRLHFGTEIAPRSNRDLRRLL